MGVDRLVGKGGASYLTLGLEWTRGRKGEKSRSCDLKRTSSASHSSSETKALCLS